MEKIRKHEIEEKEKEKHWDREKKKEKREKRKRREKQVEMNILMKGKSEQRQQWWKWRKGKNVERKNQSKNGLDKNKKWTFFFVWFFCALKWREKDLNNFKDSGNKTDFFAHKLCFSKNPREQKQKTNESVSRNFTEKQPFFIFGYMKKEQ